MAFRNKLKQGLWKSKKYYDQARSASLDMAHPGMVLLKKLVKKSTTILDLGCGEGTRLKLLLKVYKNKKGTGVDISRIAIERARKSLPDLNFVCGDLEKLPFKNNTYDLSYSAFVLEHLDKPEKVIREAIRVTKAGGYIFFIAPNFGAPNRASPNSRKSRVGKFVDGFLKDFLIAFSGQRKLGWTKVEPQTNVNRYQPDFDTTVEPYLGSLIKFLKLEGTKVIRTNSCWSEELKGAKLPQRVFRILGEAGIFPFWMWGPHLVVAAEKSYER